MSDINLQAYKIISIYNQYLYNGITPFELFTKKCYGVIKPEDFPEKYKKHHKLQNISEVVSFFCEVFNYSLVSISLDSSYYLIAFKKEEEKKNIEFLK